MTGTVSAASMIGMAVSAIISIGLPIFLMIFVRKKTRGRYGWTLIGACTFILFALVLERVLHMVVLDVFGETVTGNIWLYALYGGIAAGVFEETGRFLAMKNLKKGTLHKDNAIMYGIGHGGIESILIVGLTSVSNVMTSAIINSGAAEATLAAIDESLRDQTAAQLQLLCDTPAYNFFLAGVERIACIAFHICLSYLVYKAVQDSKILFFPLAIVLHFAIDAATLIINNKWGAIATEIVLICLVAIVAYFCFKDYKNREETQE